MRLNGIYLWRLLALTVVLLAGIGCGKGGNVPTTSIPGDANPDDGKNGKSSVTHPVQLTADPNPGDSPARNKLNLFPEFLIQTTLGDIKVRLNTEKAPATVDNFISNYASVGFYEGTVFHYVEKGFMVAAGGYSPALAQVHAYTGSQRSPQRPLQ